MAEKSKKITVGVAEVWKLFRGKAKEKRRFKCKGCGIHFNSENKSVDLKNKEV